MNIDPHYLNLIIENDDENTTVQVLNILNPEYVQNQYADSNYFHFDKEIKRWVPTHSLDGRMPVQATALLENLKSNLRCADNILVSNDNVYWKEALFVGFHPNGNVICALVQNGNDLQFFKKAEFYASQYKYWVPLNKKILYITKEELEKRNDVDEIRLI